MYSYTKSDYSQIIRNWVPRPSNATERKALEDALLCALIGIRLVRLAEGGILTKDQDELNAVALQVRHTLDKVLPL